MRRLVLVEELLSLRHGPIAELSDISHIFYTILDIHKIAILRARKDPRLALALTEARTNGLSLDDMLDRRADQASTAGDENDRLGRHIFQEGKGEGEGTGKMNVAAE